MKVCNCTDLPSTQCNVGETVHVAAEQPAATERKVVVAGEREELSGVEECRTVVRTTVVGILPVWALRSGSTATGTVVAEVVGERLAPGVIRQELETMGETTAARNLKGV
ncbi:hypothetical protein [Edaphobacter modestus]|uniref:hypothetical protein n=1 Tax=Edaphobacter modestus TaxID=388466 RepID=UPI00102D0DF5|nr:hypothetical protein [Edaphobacter modestus]